MFLGVDVGTQSLKAAVLDAESGLKEVASAHVEFDGRFPELGTRGGMIVGDGGGVVRAPARMWFWALDEALKEIAKKVDMSKILGVSGSAQQHSSVWWHDFPSQMDPSKSIVENLSEDSFSLPMSPIWADSSTTEECRKAEARIGGAEIMAKRTGSIAIERFTGNQIAKICHQDESIFEKTSIVHLLSCAFSSIFIGRIAATDASDAAGMNMMDLENREWLSNVDEVFNLKGLRDKIGELCEPNSPQGKVSDFMTKRFNFSPNCQVVSFTGDNLASLVGTSENRDDIIISLGTSDTILSQQSSRDDVNVLGGGISVFPHPIESGLFMVMVCYKNGGAVRVDVKGKERSWEEVDEALLRESTEREVVFINYPQTEIAPHVVAPCRRAFYLSGNGISEVEDVESLSWIQKIRGVVLARVMAMKTHLEDSKAEYSRVLLTGGGSKSNGIASLISQAFRCPVYTSESADSVILGAVLKTMRCMGHHVEMRTNHHILESSHAGFKSLPTTGQFREIENILSSSSSNKRHKTTRLP